MCVFGKRVGKKTRVSITLRRMLNDDVNCVVGQLSVKDFEQPSGCLEFLLFRNGGKKER
jgi:hypothetical protein